MSEYKEPYNPNRNTLVLEGMYKGVTKELDGVRETLLKELQFTSAQQVSAYESTVKTVRAGLDSILSELRYIAQQNSAVYEAESSAVQALKTEVLAKTKEAAETMRDSLSAQLAAAVSSLREEILGAINAIHIPEPVEPEKIDYDLIAQKVDCDAIAQKVAELLVPVKEEEPADETAAQTETVETTETNTSEEPVAIDYDVLAEKIASILPEVDYDTLVEKISSVIPELDQDAFAEKVAAAVPETDYDTLADRVAATVAPVDYDLIADKVQERLQPETPAEEAAPEEEPKTEESEAPAEESAQTEGVSGQESRSDEEQAAESVDYDALAEKIAQRVAETVSAKEPDYDALAEKIASVLPEPDYEQAAAPIAEHIVSVLPEPDQDEMTDKLAEAVTGNVMNAIADQFDVTVDEEGVMQIVDAVVAAIDYDTIAKKVAELLKADGSVISHAVVYAAPAEETKVEETVSEGPVEEAEEAPQEQAAEDAAEEEALEEAAEDGAGDELAAAESAAEEEDEDVVVRPVGVAETVDDPSLMLRYKRSFIAKVIQSDDDVKTFYSELKNEFLSYGKVRSQVSWSNDRYTLGRETIAKIGIRGKTLCVYLALNPDDFPLTVYHQKFAGDTKMYEKTPMMIKVKSNVALKRAFRLIESLMEKEETAKKPSPKVDYVQMYAYKDDAALLEEGLIKTSLVEKVDLNF